MKTFLTSHARKIHSCGGLFINQNSTVGKYGKNYTKCNCPNVLTNNLTLYSALNTQNKDCFTKNDTKKRFCSSNSNPPSTKLPPLMIFPEITWPSLLKTIKNFILSTIIIKPYLDRDFNLPDFVRGSKHALEVVSTKIAEGDFKSLKGLVTNEVIQSVQNSLSSMSVFQREQIAINRDDIYFSFPYQVGIMFNEGDSEQKRYVEITMVFHSLRGLAAMRESGEEPPLNMGMMPEYQNRISICNYRFIREYTKGAESDWTVNLLNHFKPSDHLNE